MSDTHILGLNAYHGDSSAALLSNGELTAAVEEERYNRIKHWAGLPVEAAAGCLAMSGVDSVQHVAVSRNPTANLFSKMLRVARQPSLIRNAAGRAVNSARIAQIKSDLASGGVHGMANAKLHFVEHHRAHMASAFFASPFEEAAVISVDGFGDFSSVMWGVGRGNKMEIRGAVRFPHSLGLFYTAFTQFLGFPKYGDEYKMMGLGAYGEPRFREKVRQVIRAEGDHVILNLDYFRHHTDSVNMSWDGAEPELDAVYSSHFLKMFGEPRRPRTEIEQRHKDMAASAQAVLEEVYFALLHHVQKQTGQKAVCLAGGVALNCVANGQIFEKSDFRDVYVQPAAHDAGTSIGAALYVWNQVLGQSRSYTMKHVYYGAEFSDSEIEPVLREAGVIYHTLPKRQLLERTAEQIAAGDIVGWFQGRMEFGPRALGNRSILADPRRADMKDILNSRIKYREPFRPFCPSILNEDRGDYFETDYPSPFMVVAYKIRPKQRERIPAVTHGDGTGRLQTVERDVNPLYWDLLGEFKRHTGVPVLINTSFNENEPIVATPAQALDCFLRTQMDVLSIGSFLLLKNENRSIAENRNVSAEVSR
jgi:carbamoyltransferase